ncbi:hypothetical protein BVY04_00420, partial [bacterium M21]
MTQKMVLPPTEPFLLFENLKKEGFFEFSGINILVGANNCGKSWFMRMLYGSKTFCDSNISQINSTISSISKERPQQNISRNLSLMFNSSEIDDNILGYSEAWGKLKNNKSQGHMCSHKKIYIPILRGLRQLGQGQEDFYKMRTVSDYFSKKDKVSNDDAGSNIFTGLTLYEELVRHLLSSIPADREAVRDFETYLSVNFFDKRKVTIIPYVPNGKTLSGKVFLKIGNDKDLEISNLGDGLQTLITIAFPIYMAQEATIFCIEEPELCMHPMMQRAFMEMLQERRRERGHTFFFTTHSNHLLDLTFDYNEISVMLFKKTSEGEIPSFNFDQVDADDFRILNDLGATSSSIFRTNATIWVEGHTDRRYLQCYMNKYCDVKGLPLVIEDRHFSFFEYQGGNIAHWSEEGEGNKIRANRIVQNSLVIADGDTKESSKEDAIRSSFDHTYFLDCKEIENMIPEEVLKKVLEAFGHNLDELKEVCFDQYYQYKSHTKYRGLGWYLDEKLQSDKYCNKSPSGKKSPAGSLKGDYKRKLCLKAVELMNQSDFDFALP